MKNFLKIKINNLAFSLMELSIVLIIISLLTAGVSSGNSLIKTARIRSFVREVNDYKDQFTIFKMMNGRYPGDWDNSGWTSVCKGINCPNASSKSYVVKKTSHDFGGEYSGTNFLYLTQPWVELYTSRIGKFKPETNANIIKNIEDGIVAGEINPFCGYGKILFPKIKSLSGTYMVNVETLKNSNENEIRNGIDNKLMAIIASKKNNDLDPKTLKRVDIKFDEGTYNNGNIRSECYYNNELNDYNYMINNGHRCSYLNFIWDI